MAFIIYGTLFRAYGPLGRVRAHFYDCMARFVFFESGHLCGRMVNHRQFLFADIRVYLIVQRILYE